MPHSINLSVNDGSACAYRFEPDMDSIEVGDLLSERPMNGDIADRLPHKVIIEARRSWAKWGRLPDVLGRGSTIMVSSRLMALIEELEPHVHVFFPVLVETEKPIFGKTRHETFFFIAAPPQLDAKALVIEETEFQKGFGFNGMIRSNTMTAENPCYAISSNPNNPCVLDAKLMGGKHFCEMSDRYAGVGLLVSDDFWKAYTDQKMKGFESYKYCRLSNATK